MPPPVVRAFGDRESNFKVAVELCPFICPVPGSDKPRARAMTQSLSQMLDRVSRADHVEVTWTSPPGLATPRSVNFDVKPPKGASNHSPITCDTV